MRLILMIVLLVFIFPSCSTTQIIKTADTISASHSTLFKDTVYQDLKIERLGENTWGVSLGKSTSITRLNAVEMIELATALTAGNATTVFELLAQ